MVNCHRIVSTRTTAIMFMNRFGMETELQNQKKFVLKHLIVESDKGLMKPLFRYE